MSTEKPRSLKMSRRSSGCGRAPLPGDERDHQRGAGEDAAPRRRAAPAPELDCCSPSTVSAIEEVTSSRPAVVERRRPALVVGLRDPDQHERDDRHRDVDPEDRAPGPLRQVAARDRPDRRQPARDPEEDRHRAAALAQRERRDDDAHRGGEHERRGSPLEHAEGHDPCLRDRARGREPAARGGRPRSPPPRTRPSAGGPRTSASRPPKANSAERASR